MQRYKTNIKCGGCVQKVKPYLDNMKELIKWDVDLNSPDRVLTVEGEVTAEKIIQAISNAGYHADYIY